MAEPSERDELPVDATEAAELCRDLRAGIGVLAFGLLVLGPPYFAAGPAEQDTLAVYVLLVGALAAALTVLNPSPIRGPVRVWRSGDTVMIERVGGRTRGIPCSSVTRVDLVPAAMGRSEVMLVGVLGPRVRLELPDSQQAEALVRKLGLDRAAATFLSRSPLLRTYPPLYGTMLLGFVGMVLGISTIFLAPLFLGLLGWMLWPARLTVGDDGVGWQWHWWSRLLSYRQIASAHEIDQGSFGVYAFQYGVKIVPHDGDPLVVPLSRAASLAVALRIRSQIARDDDSPGAVTLAHRGERSHRAWVRDLRAPDAAGLRTPAVGRELWWELVEDRNATPLDRGAAAVALGKTLPPPERKRLAEVAKSVAAPQLRVVLERSVEAEDDELAAILEKLEAKSGA